jgi:hypothetical protein
MVAAPVAALPLKVSRCKRLPSNLYGYKGDQQTRIKKTNPDECDEAFSGPVIRQPVVRRPAKLYNFFWVSRGLHSLFSVARRDLSTVQAVLYLQQQTQLSNELCPEEVESIERWR